MYGIFWKKDRIVVIDYLFYVVLKGLVPMTCEELFQEIQQKEQKQKDVSYEVQSFSLVSVDYVCCVSLLSRNINCYTCIYCYC